MSIFQFKYFSIQQSNSSLKVGTDAMLLGAFIPENAYSSILDIGTGSGVLALMAKQQNPNATVEAIDIDESALIDCQFNFENSPWKYDLNCRNQDVFTLPLHQQFDCIVCNPPYYENGLLSASESVNRTKHTIDFSLENLFIKVKALLCKNGHFRVILPCSNAEKWSAFGASIGLFLIERIVIFGKPELPKRNILVFGTTEQQVIEHRFIVRNVDNSYTEMYKELTREFHNKII